MASFIIRKTINAGFAVKTCEIVYYKNTNIQIGLGAKDEFEFTNDPLDSKSYKSAVLAEVMRVDIAELNPSENFQIVEMQISLKPIKLVTEYTSQKRS